MQAHGFPPPPTSAPSTRHPASSPPTSCCPTLQVSFLCLCSLPDRGGDSAGLSQDLEEVHAGAGCRLDLSVHGGLAENPQRSPISRGEEGGIGSTARLSGEIAGFQHVVVTKQRHPLWVARTPVERCVARVEPLVSGAFPPVCHVCQCRSSRSLNCSHFLPSGSSHFSLLISPLLISSLLQAIDDTAHPLCCIPLLCSSSLLSFSSSTPTSSRAAPPVDIAGAMFMPARTPSPSGTCVPIGKWRG